MVNLLPKKDTQQDQVNTELLATHRSFFQQYGVVIVLLLLVGLVAVIVFGGVLYKTGTNLVRNYIHTTTPSKDPQRNPKDTNNTFSDLKLETGYTLKKNDEWELVILANEPQSVEIIASSAFNATRIEISSYAKTYPNWEEQIGLTYFDVTSEDMKTIEDYEVLVQSGTDGSLSAKSGRWEDAEKALEIRVFSITKQNTDKVFTQIAKSVKNLTDIETQDEFTDAEESTISENDGSLEEE
jgi:hypothetical protein